MILLPGSFVTHAKLLDLGSGEVVFLDEKRIRIRFASGERSFDYDRVVHHLTVTSEGPPPASTKKAAGAGAKKKAAPKAAAKSK